MGKENMLWSLSEHQHLLYWCIDVRNHNTGETSQCHKVGEGTNTGKLS